MTLYGIDAKRSWWWWWGCCFMMRKMMRMMMMRVRVLLDGGKSWHKEAWMSHTRLRQDVTPRHSWAATSEESHHQAGVTKCYKVTQVVTLVLPSLKNWRLKNDIHGRELEPLKEEKPLQFVKKAKSTKVRFNTRDKKKLNCNAWVSTLQSEGEQVSPGNTHNLEHKN